MFSRRLLSLLSEKERVSPLFPNEDALLSTFMRRVGVNPTDNNKFLPFVYCEQASVEKLKEANMCGLSKQFIVHGVREKQQLKIHFNSTLLNSLPSFCNLQNGYENLRNQCHTQVN